MEECVGWCREVIVDPAPLKRIGREWRKRAVGMRTLLEALYVRSNPKRFVVGLQGPLMLSQSYWGRSSRGTKIGEQRLAARTPGLS